MPRRHRAASLLAAFCLVPAVALAQGTAQVGTPAAPALYAAIGDRPAVMYDALSVKANKTFILFRHTPVEVLVKLDKWTKVRDADGTVGWIENSALGDRRFAQVTAAVAEVRASPSASATAAFEAQRGVLLEATGPASDGWLPVRHRDGQSGFVRASQVWGG